MESSDAETGMVDCSVGTIVWVRRRNGSWWPGKILGPDELSASHLMSPRSGTPVKLLGREDASVDWYNLEKSKRVKPFRCGEFDDCIERAEASQGMPPKKREKYARREDAILHALELEKQLLEKKYGNDDENRKRLDTQLNVDDVRHRLQDTIPIPIPISIPIPIPVPIPIPLKNKPTIPVVSKRNENSIPVPVGSKRKRSISISITEESIGKRRDRRRPLVQVLQNHPLQLHHHHHHHELNEEEDKSFEYRETEVDFEKGDDGLNQDNNNNSTGSNEDTETDSSGTESLLSDTYDAMAALSDEGDHIEFIPKAFGRSGEGEEESMSDESSDSQVTVSKWQLKGKRNNRNLTKRYPYLNLTERILNIKGDEIDDDDSNWEEHEHEQEHEHDDYHHHHHHVFGGRRMLIDVDVQVQSGYLREHVPMISLMSKLNDKAIVGHPIPTETLEDGSSDIILSASFDDDDDEDLQSLTLQPWRTARRTAKCRVPRLSTLEEEDEETAAVSTSFEYIIDKGGRKPKHLKKPQKRNNNNNTSSSSCNQKTRTLSSIGGTHQQQLQNMKGEEEDEGGLMKRAVACIPVKLVFSRLHEELVSRHQ